MNKTKTTTKTITVTALFAIIIAVCSWISFPIASVPMTLQTFAVALTGYVLGYKRGTVCTLIYLIMGAIGIPVFSSFRGGFQVLLSPSGGFLFGFLALAFLCGLNTKSTRASILLGLLGLVICHILGIAQLSVVTSVSPVAAFLSASLPFILKDAVSIILARFIALRIGREITL